MNLITWGKIKDRAKGGHIDWRSFLDERQLKEIEFDIIYVNQFEHGTDGHNARQIIARMAELLDVIRMNVKVEGVE